MRIGFDAKRAYHNSTGLGNYSRTLMNGLMHFYPKHEYYGFNPVRNLNYSVGFNAKYIEVNPTSFLDKCLPSLWRSSRMKKEINELKIDVFHGLSNELPTGIEKCTSRNVVTIHDLIFEYYPEQYNASDVKIYRHKFKKACDVAHEIIAISEATKQDIIKLYGVDSSKITVCYQSCDDRFLNRFSESEFQQLNKRYSLPDQYFISVGSIIERKNLLKVCSAFSKLDHNNIGLVVVGKGNEYKQKVVDLIKKEGIEHQVIFLEDHFSSADIFRDLPLLYQRSIGLIYPSQMEGFGIPIVEAFSSAIPVITSNCSSMQEIGQGATLLIDPSDEAQYIDAFQTILGNDSDRKQLIQKGTEALAKFTTEQFVRSVMDVYL